MFAFLVREISIVLLMFYIISQILPRMYIVNVDYRSEQVLDDLMTLKKE